MNNTPYSANTAEIAASANTTDIFACYQHTPSLWIVALICIGASMLVAKWLLPLVFAKEDEAPEIDNGMILNEHYLKEILRLSELRLLEINLAIQSYEKKALAIIAGAAALVGFFLTRNLCGQLSDGLIIVSMGLCVVSAWFAILTLSQMNIGVSGIDPPLLY